MAIQGLPGGGRYSLTTTETVIDLSALAGYEVLMYVAAQDWLFSFAPTAAVAPQTLIVAATAADATSLFADDVGATIKIERQVMIPNTKLVAKVAAGTGLLVIKPTRKV